MQLDVIGVGTYLVVWLVNLVYFVFWFKGLWRAASVYDGRRLWAILAKISAGFRRGFDRPQRFLYRLSFSADIDIIFLTVRNFLVETNAFSRHKNLRNSIKAGRNSSESQLQSISPLISITKCATKMFSGGQQSESHS